MEANVHFNFALQKDNEIRVGLLLMVVSTLALFGHHFVGAVEVGNQEQTIRGLNAF